MITINRKGRLGNQLFSYCFGRILADGLGYHLRPFPIDGIPGTQVPVLGAIHHSPEEILTGHNPNLPAILSDRRERQVILDGYFQNYRFYAPYAEQIRGEWLGLEPIACKLRQNHIAITVRLGDFQERNLCLCFSYFQKILESESFGAIYLLSDDLDHPFLDRFQEFGEVIRWRADPVTTLRAAASFEKIIMANSTFSWWLAFLSEAQRIYFPIPEPFAALGSWGMHRLGELDLRIPSKRYRYVENAPLWGYSHPEKQDG